MVFLLSVAPLLWAGANIFAALLRDSMIVLKIMGSVIGCHVAFALLRSIPDLLRYVRICWL